MRAFFYAIVAFAFGVFMVGCADYAENGIALDDEYSEEIIVESMDSANDEVVLDEDLADDEVATNDEATDDGIASMVSDLATTAPSDEPQSTESSEISTTDDSQATQNSEIQDSEIVIAQESKTDEITESSAITDDTNKATDIESQEPQIAQDSSAPQAKAMGITKIDDNTFEYNGMVFKHNLGKDANLDAILSALKKEQSQTPKVEPQSIDTPKTAQDSSQMAVAGSPKITKKISGKGLKGLTQSTAKLKASCEENGDLQKCEDLGRIYATRGNISQAVTYYEQACNNGEGLALSCFFLAKIYENDNNSEVAGHYASLIDESTLKSAKVGRTELLLSTGKANTLKRNLKMSCAKGNEGSCNTLQSVFKVRGEKHEMKTFFGTECWKGSELGCTILRSM